MMLSMEEIKENRPVKLALRLLPWLVAGAVAIILAQVLKTDLEKGWATWLQALVTIGIGAGADKAPQGASEDANAHQLSQGDEQQLPPAQRSINK
ncbi:g5272 [Coccomyxa viridis]|uniref:G5272 protein n=1 Tax=Coccomyxa viridis TaxID=1274662 RepID=A0ABP1FXI3_9CHLO